MRGPFDGVRMQVRPISDYPVPETPPHKRQNSPFKGRMGRETPITATLDLLERELVFLDAKAAVIEADFTDGSIRNDGWPRSTARAATPRVVLSFDSRHGPLRYPCDTFTTWEANLRAIALALEALRKVDRYNVTRRGEQYTGFRRLSDGTPTIAMSVDDAARVLARYGPHSADAILETPEFAEQSIRQAQRQTHPDLNPERGADFIVVQAAAKLVRSLHA